MQSEQINELASALAKAQANMTHAQKTVDNPFFKSKFADLPEVINAARPHLTAQGLSVVQVTDLAADGAITLTTQLCHASGQWISGVYPVKPVKNDPQGFGSALTYARRYAYAAIVGVASTGEDDDGNLASGKAEKVTHAKKRYKELKDKILESANPSETWTDNLDEINGFLEVDKTFYDDLVQAGAKRKKELEAIKLSGNGLKDVNDE